MPEGGTLSIRARNETVEEADDRTWAAGLAPGDYVELTVSDTGIGIAADDVDKIFEPFFSTKESGTGLGLATVYGIVKQSDGHIAATSTPGRGTTMTVWLPATAESEEKHPLADGRADEEEMVFCGTVLVVEDDAAVRGVAEQILERRGCTVVTANNAEEALAALRASHVDLMLTDVIMPGISGVQLARRARELHPALRVLLTSGYTANELRDSSAVGETPFLQKPFTPRDLIAAVQRCHRTTPTA